MKAVLIIFLSVILGVILTNASPAISRQHDKPSTGLYPKICPTWGCDMTEGWPLQFDAPNEAFGGMGKYSNLIRSVAFWLDVVFWSVLSAILISIALFSFKKLKK